MGSAYERFGEVLRKARKSRAGGTGSQEWIARKLTSLHEGGDERIPRPVSRSLLARWERPRGDDMPQPPIDPRFVQAIAEVYGANETELYDVAADAWLEHNGGHAVAGHYGRKLATVQAELDSVREQYEAEHRDHELRSGLRPTERELIWTVRRVSDHYPGATNAIAMLVRFLFPAASGDVPDADDPGAGLLASVVAATHSGRAWDLLTLLTNMARHAHPAEPDVIEQAPRVGRLRPLSPDELQAAVLDVLSSRPGDSEAHDRAALALDAMLDELRRDSGARTRHAAVVAARRPSDDEGALAWYLGHRLAHDFPVFRRRLAASLPRDHALLLEYRELREALAGPPMPITDETRAAIMRARDNLAQERD